MSKMKIGYKRPVRQALRAEIRKCEESGTITFTEQEFKQMILRIEGEMRQQTSRAYERGYLNG